MGDLKIDKDKQGRIIVHPLTAYQFSRQGLEVFVRLEWAEERPGLKRPRAKSVQLHLPPELADLIGRTLVEAAAQHGEQPSKPN